jgi:NAD(P)H-hydrate epimerase
MAIPESLHLILAGSLHEPTWLLLPEQTGVIAPDATRLIRQEAPRYDSVLLGCGLTREKAAAEFVSRLLDTDQEHRSRLGFVSQPENSPATATALPPMVLDADALNILAQMPDWDSRLPTECVLTPHPGEMARLCRCSTEDIAANRWEIAQDKAHEWKQVLLLKGAHTLVCAPDGRATVIPFANPGLATAGSGDVLAGAITGLLAQGLDSYSAALCGAYIHALAGELAGEEVGRMGMVAGDLLLRIPKAIGLLTESLY